MYFIDKCATCRRHGNIAQGPNDKICNTCKLKRTGKTEPEEKEEVKEGSSEK